MVTRAETTPDQESMMMVVPRVVLGAPSSGHGTGALALGLLAAPAEPGLAVAAGAPAEVPA
ncbi:hypothetical protein ABZ570_19840 [Micromonospora sp. NPDC007271]|uniref:hypothetical protein n=1 Tax=Micromonospora sp. NPDC007271 TaxID=3154587 RepID=UPI0033C92973